MKKRYWWQSWSRLLLWMNVIGFAGFYLTLWLRTRPDQNERIKVLPDGDLQKQQAVPAQVKEKSENVRGVLKKDREDTNNPLVSVIVPARNEERNISRCVQSLLDQDYKNYEVIVVDDGSTDRTGVILDSLIKTHPHGDRLWVLQLKDLPADWAGKPHALHCGVLEASGSWLLFTDADTWHAPEALRTAITTAIEEKLDLLTLNTTQELPTFWEKTLMPIAFMGVSMLYPPRQVNDPVSQIAIANGQYLMIKRSVYEQTGGYAREDMRTTLVDDRDMARLVKGQGFTLRFMDSSNLVHTRMYQSLNDIHKGWLKNAYLGNRGGLPFFLLQIIGLPMVTIAPFLVPSLIKLLRRSGLSIQASEEGLLNTLALGPVLAYRTWLNRMMNIPWYYIFTHPLGGAFFTGILGESVWRIITRKGVDWRGRQYHNK